MVVNLSVIGHYFFRLRQRGGLCLWVNLASPVVGFLICVWIWLSVSPLAMKVGWAWTILGLVYLFRLTHGFQKGLGNTDSAA